MLRRLLASPSVQDVIVPDQTLDARIGICAACEFRIASALGAMCAKCGCLLSLKTRLRSADCPIGRWTCQSPAGP